MDTIISKAGGARVADTRTFVMAHDDRDHVNDTNVASAMKFNIFNSNPVALLSHERGNLPVGIWTNIRKQGGALLGDLQIASAGTSRITDVTRSLIDQGILRAVSVGFKGIKSKPNKFGGTEFEEAELLECSLVSVPMNPKAIIVAKSLGMSDDELKQFFTIEADADDVVKKELEKQQLLRSETVRRKAAYALINASRLQRRLRNHTLE